LSALIWSVADLLRGDYKPSEYGRVILPFTVLRRLDCVLAPAKAAVLAEKKARVPLGKFCQVSVQSCPDWRGRGRGG
jgi:type I restriction enzyme M protein